MKLDPEIVAQLRDLVCDQGLELVATESAGSGPKMVLRLVVDGPDGVSLDRCADISREASALLDVEDPISHRYTLEVSSPGLDRKFYSAADYDRFAGQRVAIRMQPSYREHRTASGTSRGAVRRWRGAPPRGRRGDPGAPFRPGLRGPPRGGLGRTS
jgi:ribosome maturation factor RimP